MKSILKELYFGNIVPTEQFQPISEDYKKQLKSNSVHYEEFEEKLKNIDNSLIPLFHKIYDDLFLEIPHENECAFVCGFRLGVRIILEAMQEE